MWHVYVHGCGLVWPQGIHVIAIEMDSVSDNCRRIKSARITSIIAVRQPSHTYANGLTRPIGGGLDYVA